MGFNSGFKGLTRSGFKFLTGARDFFYSLFMQSSRLSTWHVIFTVERTLLAEPKKKLFQGQFIKKTQEDATVYQNLYYSTFI